MRAIIIQEFGMIILKSIFKIIIFIISIIGDANVCKLMNDVPIPNIQSGEVKFNKDIYYILKEIYYSLGINSSTCSWYQSSRYIYSIRYLLSIT